MLNFQLFYEKQFWQICFIQNNKESEERDNNLKQRDAPSETWYDRSMLNKCVPVFYLIKKVTWHSSCLTHIANQDDNFAKNYIKIGWKKNMKKSFRRPSIYIYFLLNFAFFWSNWWFQRKRFLVIEHKETRIDYGDHFW
jgi:hypothetical protein